ncbi:MAG: rhomboid family intramembrane serine protease [Ferruginibacter sp.]
MAQLNMRDSGTIGIIILIVNVIFSYRGFTNARFFDGYKFEVDRILIYKDYKRLVTSGFLHISWTHLIFNMVSLIFFSGSVESYLGGIKFLIIYLASLLGGNLFTLLIHKNHGDYNSVGASGAVCGIIFASIALFPGMSVGIFFIPMSIPGWLYGLLYVLYSIYGIKSKKGNIGHEAHLGGALIGMTVALLMEPSAFIENYLTIIIIAVPTLVFIYIIITRPQLLLIDNFFFKTHQKAYTIDQRYNLEKIDQQKEIDRILDKINKKGINSLSKSESQKLKEYAKKM